MKNTNELKIRLTPSQITPVSLWVDRFCQHQDSMFARPEISGNSLLIHPTDLINLLAHYADKDDANEFDVFRLKASGVAELKKAIARKKNETVKGNYLSCLRILKDVAPNSSPYTCRTQERRSLSIAL